MSVCGKLETEQGPLIWTRLHLFRAVTCQEPVGPEEEAVVKFKAQSEVGEHAASCINICAAELILVQFDQPHFLSVCCTFVQCLCDGVSSFSNQDVCSRLGVGALSCQEQHCNERYDVQVFYIFIFIKYSS